MWTITPRIASGLIAKNLEYVVTHPNSKVTYGPFSLEVKAQEQANRLNRPAPGPQYPT